MEFNLNTPPSSDAYSDPLLPTNTSVNPEIERQITLYRLNRSLLITSALQCCLAIYIYFVDSRIFFILYTVSSVAGLILIIKDYRYPLIVYGLSSLAQFCFQGYLIYKAQRNKDYAVLTIDSSVAVFELFLAMLAAHKFYITSHSYLLRTHYQLQLYEYNINTNNNNNLQYNNNHNIHSINPSSSNHANVYDIVSSTRTTVPNISPAAVESNYMRTSSSHDSFHSNLDQFSRSPTGSDYSRTNSTLSSPSKNHFAPLHGHELP
jgi:hypothetical protein